jgi:hypothetical protein
MKKVAKKSASARNSIGQSGYPAISHDRPEQKNRITHVMIRFIPFLISDWSRRTPSLCFANRVDDLVADIDRADDGAGKRGPLLRFPAHLDGKVVDARLCPLECSG